MQAIQVETNNIKQNYELINDKNFRFYEHPDLGKAYSITTIINGGSILKKNSYMYRGEQIHKVIECSLKGKKAEAVYIYNSLNKEDKAKIEKLYNYFHTKLSQLTHSELSFIANDNGLKWGGTIDILSTVSIEDLKTGDLARTNYCMQVAAGAKPFNKKEAAIPYFNGEELHIYNLNEQSINKYYEAFKSRIKAMEGKYDATELELLAMLENIKAIKAQKEEIEEMEKTAMLEAKEFAKANNKTMCKLGANTIYEVSDSITNTLKDEFKQSLLISNPEFFEKKIRKGYIAIRLGE